MVRFENVGLRYGHGPEILRDITFSLERGSFRFLTGPSGAGKSSLLRLLFLKLKPTRGFIHLFDRDIACLRHADLPALRRRIGVVFQDFKLLDHLSAYDNVALPLRAAGLRPDVYRSNVRELLEWVGLEGQADMFPPVLSGGEKQRLAIARAVVAKPELLLADEPTGNVDPALATRLLHLFQELNRFGTTVLIATHDPHLIATTKFPVLALEKGRLN
ncbi:MAG TPA: cell division ATP-binding protein FtsE [Aestuariivirgaceae bacterium]